MFIFGMTAEEVEARRPHYNPWDIYHADEEIRLAVEMIERDFFNLMEPGIFRPITDALLVGGDHYMLLADLRDYIQTQERVDQAYKDRDAWLSKAILNVARAGKFSSDRTIREYASDIWRVSPCGAASH
jgi:starch phosphorylase